ncbi:MAG: C39 family peptidase [Chloroflexota bacterium]
MPSKSSKTTSGAPRVPSNVPNDMDHLGVPGSLNMSLGGGPRRRRPQARRRSGMPAWVKTLLALAGGAFAFGVVALVIFLIVFPSFFRGLEPRYQSRIMHYFPPATYWMPTRPFSELPTLSGAESGREDASRLLTQAALTQTAKTEVALTQPLTPAPGSAPLTGGEGAGQAQPTATGEGIPVGALTTQQPTPLPSLPSPTPNLAPTWTPLVAPTTVPLPPAARLGNIRYEEQGWNNCGPTTMTMALSYFGWSQNQYTAANWMKPHTEDKNVSPWQMVRFVHDNTGLKALYRYGGTIELVKRLVAAGFPVVIEKGFQPAGEDWMGHYLLVMGYDDSQQRFLAYDSYLGNGSGNGLPHPYSIFDENWRHFNRVFIVVYEPSREMELRNALGGYADPAYGYQIALETARAEAAQNNGDKWAWFNMGTAYTLLNEYENAAIAYDQAFQLQLPWRMLWYQFGPYEAYFRTGRFEDVLLLADTNRNITPYVEETYYWKGVVYAAQGDTQAALRELDRALYYNKNFVPAQEAKAQVEAGTFQVAAAR